MQRNWRLVYPNPSFTSARRPELEVEGTKIKEFLKRTMIDKLQETVKAENLHGRLFTSCWKDEEISQDAYGKPNGAKFKRQNCLHIQQIFYQGQDRFPSSTSKSSHIQQICYQGQDRFSSSSLKLSHVQHIFFQGRRAYF